MQQTKQHTPTPPSLKNTPVGEHRNPEGVQGSNGGRAVPTKQPHGERSAANTAPAPAREVKKESRAPAHDKAPLAPEQRGAQKPTTAWPHQTAPPARGTAPTAQEYPVRKEHTHHTEAARHMQKQDGTQSGSVKQEDKVAAGAGGGKRQNPQDTARHSGPREKEAPDHGGAWKKSRADSGGDDRGHQGTVEQRDDALRKEDRKNRAHKPQQTVKNGELYKLRAGEAVSYGNEHDIDDEDEFIPGDFDSSGGESSGGEDSGSDAGGGNRGSGAEDIGSEGGSDGSAVGEDDADDDDADDMLDDDDLDIVLEDEYKASSKELSQIEKEVYAQEDRPLIGSFLFTDDFLEYCVEESVRKSDAEPSGASGHKRKRGTKDSVGGGAPRQNGRKSGVKKINITDQKEIVNTGIKMQCDKYKTKERDGGTVEDPLSRSGLTHEERYRLLKKAMTLCVYFVINEPVKKRLENPFKVDPSRGPFSDPDATDVMHIFYHYFASYMGFSSPHDDVSIDGLLDAID
jgi:hypothetical protein